LLNQHYTIDANTEIVLVAAPGKTLGASSLAFADLRRPLRAGNSVAGERQRQLELLRAPRTAEEIAELESRVGKDPRVVNPIARYGFPQELLTLFEWCNGGEFRRGQRDFAPLFTLAEIREYLVAYGVVHYLPNCIPIGMDGGACFYLLDLSSQPARVFLGGSNELDDANNVGPLADGVLAAQA
jgi:hypothetical protein